MQADEDLRAALAISERRRKEVQRLAEVGFWELDLKSGHLHWSEEIYRLFGLKEGTFQPSYERFLALVHEDDRDIVDQVYRDSIAAGTDYRLRNRIQLEGVERWVEIRGATFFDAQGAPERSIGTVQDIGAAQRAEQALAHVALHDPLTDLPNRKHFTETVSLEIRRAARDGHRLAVFFIDLDNFKRINDSRGHHVGDRVLQAVARRLKEQARAGDSYARFGGDEFVGLIVLREDDLIENTARRVKAAVEQYRPTEADNFSLSASIGVSVYPADGGDPDMLIRHADHAMYQAKEDGKARICFFDSGRYLANLSRQDFLRAIEKALSTSEFELYLQPRISLLDGTVCGAEALLRWFRPEATVAPAQVIAAISGTALEWRLDLWVVEQALICYARLREQGLGIPVSVNIMPGTLERHDFPASLAMLLSKYCLPGDALELEVLEVSPLGDLDRTAAMLRQCKALGISISLDDFGTGYSSLSHFHALPIDTVKIDQQFVRGLGVEQHSLPLVQSIIATAAAMERPVVAEGVECWDAARQLCALGCAYAQGYAISRPMPPDRFSAWALAHRAESMLAMYSSPASQTV